MGFFGKLFSKKKKDTEELFEVEQDIYSGEGINFHSEEQRSRFITNCIEQMNDSNKEIASLTDEYAEVTSYLCDMEEIEALPENERLILDRIATTLVVLEQERKQYTQKENRMSDSEFYHMRKQEEEVVEGIGKLKECEEYASMVKQDLGRLKSEKKAFEYRKQEMESNLNNLRGISGISMIALVVCLIMLCVFQFALHMDAFWGFFAAILFGAGAVTFICIKYMDSKRELQRIRGGINRLIVLQNKVKIKYVNNANLLEYLCLKYETTGAKQLEQRWSVYQQEKEDRQQYAEIEQKMEEYQNQLVRKLAGFNIKTPERWRNQAEAILDKKEMVEIRHDLILRRQALRKQLEYNRQVAENANKAMNEVAERYPQYGKEIQDMINRSSQN